MYTYIYTAQQHCQVSQYLVGHSFFQHYRTRICYIVTVSVLQHCMYDPIYLIGTTVYSVVQIKDYSIELSFLVPVSEVLNVVTPLSVCFITS